MSFQWFNKINDMLWWNITSSCSVLISKIIRKQSKKLFGLKVLFLLHPLSFNSRSKFWSWRILKAGNSRQKLILCRCWHIWHVLDWKTPIFFSVVICLQCFTNFKISTFYFRRWYFRWIPQILNSISIFWYLHHFVCR